MFFQVKITSYYRPVFKPFGCFCQPWEDDLQLKMTLDERQALVEDDLRLKMTLDERQTLVEDDLRWETTVGGRQLSVEDNLQWFLACCLVRFAAFFCDSTY